MITRIPPNGFLQARYVFTKSPDLENNKLYNMTATAVNKEGVVLTYCYRKEQWKNLKVNYDAEYPIVYVKSKVPLIKSKRFKKTLIKDKRLKKTLRLHKLVYFTFAEVPTDIKGYTVKDYSKYEINHKDLNKKNPRYQNLELCTPSQNCLHYRKYPKGGEANNIPTTIPLYKPNTNQLSLDI